MKKNVLIIAYAFPPHSVVGAMRPMRFCKYLPIYSNWRPVVLSVKKNFIRNDISLLREFSDNIPVYRAPIIEPKLWYETRRALNRKPPAENSPMRDGVKHPSASATGARLYLKKIKRLLEELVSTPDPQLFWTLPVVWKALKIIRKHRIDALIVTSPPWSVQVSGYLIKRLTGIPWIADLRDPWTDVPRYDRLKLTRKIDAFLERKCLVYADKVISTSHTFSDQLRKRFPETNPNRFVTLYNGFDEEKFSSISPRSSKNFTIVHLGTFYPLFDSFFILEGIGQWLANDSEVDKSRIRIVFVGQIQGYIEKVLEDNGLSDITEITGFKPHTEAIDIAAGADVLLLSIGLSPLTPKGWLPSKIFEYIALNRPILASVVNGEASDLIRRSQSGYAITDRNHRRVYDILHALYIDKMRAPEFRSTWNNDETVVHELKQAHLIGRLSGVLDEITERNHRPPKP